MARRGGGRGQKRAAKVRERRNRLVRHEQRREGHARLVTERQGDPLLVERRNHADGTTTIAVPTATPGGALVSNGSDARITAFRTELGRDPGRDDALVSDLEAWSDRVEYYLDEALGDAFDADEFEEEPDQELAGLIARMELVCLVAVGRTIRERTTDVARVLGEFITADGLVVTAAETSDLDVEDVSEFAGLARPVAYVVLAGWLTGIRERQPDVAMAEPATSWIDETLGPEAAAAAHRGSALLSEPVVGESARTLIDELGDDLVPALVWLTSGAVARFGDGDVAWLPVLE
jgi:hypothetical protein